MINDVTDTYMHHQYHSHILSNIKGMCLPLIVFLIISQPGVQYSNTNRVRFTVISHTPMHSRFYHTHIMYKWNWDGSCLVNLIYFVLHIFQIRNLLNCVDESWWYMSSKKMRLGDGVANDAVARLLPLWLNATALWCHVLLTWFNINPGMQK